MLPALWGSTLWNFLHAFSDRVGRGPAITRADETREALWLVDHLEAVIPCKYCREHWHTYRRSHPGLPTAEWMFTAHNAVNRTLGKPELEICPPAAAPREAWGAYTSILKESLTRGYLKGVLVSEFSHHVRLWSSFS
jgi:hypothetical protein